VDGVKRRAATALDPRVTGLLAATLLVLAFGIPAATVQAQDDDAAAPATAEPGASAPAADRYALVPQVASSPDERPASSRPAGDDDLELELDQQPTSFPDPFESLNRETLSLNQTVDHWVFSPVTRVYGSVMPDRAKRSVRDFFANLESPAIFVNDVLQGHIDDAATTFLRFSVNTIVGIAGLFDPASAMGLERKTADFGQTLARSGVGSGPFLIVPLLGPTTVRDGIGTLVDVAMQPTIYLLGPAPLFVASVEEGTEGLTLREQHGADMERLEQASLDYYAALRSAYYQNRMATLGEGPAGATGEAGAGSGETHPGDPPT
jgi:phospholipid-binding lipoprotein MlaA